MNIYNGLEIRYEKRGSYKTEINTYFITNKDLIFRKNLSH